MITGLVLLVFGNEIQCKLKALRPRLAHPRLKGPITLIDDMRRETMQLSMPSSVERPQCESPQAMTKRDYSQMVSDFPHADS